MVLGNIFKKDKKIKEKKGKEKEGVKKIRKEKAVEVLAPKAEKKSASEVRPPSSRARASGGQGWKILSGPHVTEKASDLTKQNQYAFKVWSRANKTEIKKAVEDVYGVDVVRVRIIKIPRKKRRLGKIKGWRKGYKKAIVRLKEGQKIEVLPR